ncbi:hypothetical protein [Vallitalea guaymasensis]|uniref:hypothetical protein n=1 Tax=Vallitalea guaymasensis TaxID=1185412 RepID=UPI000DE536E5|nr:hypothetical protein [Vallitalea guaymasensis]
MNKTNMKKQLLSLIKENNKNDLILQIETIREVIDYPVISYNNLKTLYKNEYIVALINLATAKGYSIDNRIKRYYNLYFKKSVSIIYPLMVQLIESWLLRELFYITNQLERYCINFSFASCDNYGYIEECYKCKHYKVLSDISFCKAIESLLVINSSSKEFNKILPYNRWHMINEFDSGYSTNLDNYMRVKDTYKKGLAIPKIAAINLWLNLMHSDGYLLDKSFFASDYDEIIDLLNINHIEYLDLNEILNKLTEGHPYHNEVHKEFEKMTHIRLYSLL